MVLFLRSLKAEIIARTLFFDAKQLGKILLDLVEFGFELLSLDISDFSHSPILLFKSMPIHLQIFVILAQTLSELILADGCDNGFHRRLDIVDYTADFFHTFLIVAVLNESDLHILSGLFFEQPYVFVADVVDKTDDSIVELLKLPDLNCVVVLDIH